MMRLGAILVITLALSGFVGLASPAAQTPVPVDENNRDLLNGTWTGKFERVTARGATFETALTLDIGGIPQAGRFSLGGGMKWESPVRVDAGKIYMGADAAPREFTLTRRDGTLRLATQYEMGWRGSPATVRMSVEKK